MTLPAQVLELISARGPMSFQDISNVLDRSRWSTQSAVRDLKRKGYLVAINPEDRCFIYARTGKPLPEPRVVVKKIPKRPETLVQHAIRTQPRSIFELRQA